jgi:chromosome segregation ATPase
MQEVIRSDRDIILELQREAEKGHDILDELKTLQDLMNSQKSPNQDPYSEPPDYEEFDNRAADFTTVSTKSHGHEVIEVKSENEADEDKEGEAEGETDEEDVGKFPQTPFQKEAAHFQEQIPILEERHRNLKEAVRELESKQAEIEAKVAKLENKLLEAQRKREEYEGKTVFGKIWAWIAWLARCGSED